MTFKPFKGRNKTSKQLTLVRELREIWDASASAGETWLLTDWGKPYSDGSLGNFFREWCDAAGLPQCTSHGLRKAGAVLAAEAGASEHELMAMFGWQDANMARVYTKKATQQKMDASGREKVRQLRASNAGRSVPT